MTSLHRFAPLAIALGLSLATSVHAQQAVPAEEPQSIFTRGPSPAWQLLHVEAAEFPELHREWHKQMTAKKDAWHRDWADKVDTPAYQNTERDFYRTRELAHRLYHAPIVKTETDEAAEDDLSVDLPPHSPFEGEFEGMDAVQWQTASHWYTGPRPTRRSIVEQWEKRQAK